MPGWSHLEASMEIIKQMPRFYFYLFSVTLVVLLSSVLVTKTWGQDARLKQSKNAYQKSDTIKSHQGRGLSDGPEDPENLLPLINQRRTQKNSLIHFSGLEAIHDASDRG